MESPRRVQIFARTGCLVAELKGVAVALWESDGELFDLVKRELFTGVVGDVMERFGLLRQFLPPQIRPLRDNMVLIGRAMPALEVPVFGEADGSGANPIMARPQGLVFESIDALQPNDVYICYSRDTREIRQLGFPCFSRGSYAQDQGRRAKVMDYRVPVQIGDAYIRPGDIIFGDVDGVCVVPREAEEQTFNTAFQSVGNEDAMKQALLNGMSLVEAVRKHS